MTRLGRTLTLAAACVVVLLLMGLEVTLRGVHLIIQVPHSGVLRALAWMMQFGDELREDLTSRER